MQWIYTIKPTGNFAVVSVSMREHDIDPEHGRATTLVFSMHPEMTNIKKELAL